MDNLGWLVLVVVMLLVLIDPTGNKTDRAAEKVIKYIDNYVLSPRRR